MPDPDVQPDRARELAYAECQARFIARTSDSKAATLIIAPLLAEYDRMRAELAENVGVMNALRRQRDTAKDELTVSRPVVEAATALVKRFEDDLCEVDQGTSHWLDVLADALRPDPKSDRRSE